MTPKRTRISSAQAPEIDAASTALHVVAGALAAVLVGTLDDNDALDWSRNVVGALAAMEDMGDVVDLEAELGASLRSWRDKWRDSGRSFDRVSDALVPHLAMRLAAVWRASRRAGDPT